MFRINVPIVFAGAGNPLGHALGVSLRSTIKQANAKTGEYYLDGFQDIMREVNNVSIYWHGCFTIMGTIAAILRFLSNELTTFSRG